MSMSRFLWLLLFVSIAIVSCKKDEQTTDLTISSVLSGTTDLNGATAATNVSVSNDIVITLSAEIDANTASNSSVMLKRGTVTETTVVTASGKTVTINPAKNLQGGTKYTLTLNGIATSDGTKLATTTVTFTTGGIGFDTPPQAASQTVYLPFSGGIEDIAGTATKAYEKVAYGEDRFGTAEGAALFRGATTAGTGDIVELTGTQFVNASSTISFWIKVAAADYVAPGNKPVFGIGAEKGYFFEMGDGTEGPNWIKFASNHKVSPDPKAHGMATAWGDGTPVGDIFKDNAWHQVVFTYDAGTYTKTSYVDGIKAHEWALDDTTASDEWNLKDMMLDNVTAGVDGKLTLGFFCSRANTATGWATYSSAVNTFKGSLDDFRIFNKVLTETEVNTLYTREKP